MLGGEGAFRVVVCARQAFDISLDFLVNIGLWGLRDGMYTVVVSRCSSFSAERREDMCQPRARPHGPCAAHARPTFPSLPHTAPIENPSFHAHARATPHLLTTRSARFRASPRKT